MQPEMYAFVQGEVKTAVTGTGVVVSREKKM